MAKVVAYKLVSPPAGIKNPAAIAARSQLFAINRVGNTVSSMADSLNDIAKISNAFKRTETEIEKQQRRRLQRERDNAAEEAQERKGIEQGKTDKEFNKEIKKKPKKGLLGGLLKSKNGFFGFLGGFMAPIAGLLAKIAGTALFLNLLVYLKDPENTEKVKVFIEKTGFVFNKLFEFASKITGAIMTTVDNLFGKEKTIGDRLKGLGTVIGAITGITGILMAIDAVGDLLNLGRDAEDAADAIDSVNDARKALQKGKKAKNILKNVTDEFGEAAGKKAKKILAETGEDGLRIFQNALKNTKPEPGNLVQATKAYNRQIKKLTAVTEVAGDLANKADDVKSASKSASKGKNIFQRGFDNLVDTGKKLGTAGLEEINKRGKQLANLIETGWSLASKKAGPSILDALKSLPSKAVKAYDSVSKASKNALDFGVNKVKGAYNWAADGLASLGAKAKKEILDRLMAKFKPLIDNITKIVSPMVDSVGKVIMKIPGMDKAPKVLKSIGIDGGIGAIPKAGKILGKRAMSFLPLVGSIVNFLFAYDRLSKGDTIGALLEGSSGGLELAGYLGTAGTLGAGAPLGAGAVAAGYFIDGYMFLRDLIPEMQTAEEKFVNKIPGVNKIKPVIDKVVADMLPSFGTIVGAVTGNKGLIEGMKNESYEGQGSRLEEKAAGGLVPMRAAGGTVPMVGMPNTMNGIVKTIKPHLNPTIPEHKIQPIIQKVENQIQAVFISGGLSQDIAIKESADEMLPVPIIMQTLVPIPTAVPINKGGGGTSSISSVTSRRL